MNYKHLHYFWVVAKTGGVSSASDALHITPQTISGQISILEDALGHKLFTRKGKRLILTPTGSLVYKYAEQIFSLGEELYDELRGDRSFGQGIFSVGIMDCVPKIIAQKILSPLMQDENIRIICREGSFDYLVSKLAVRELDMVISDMPLSSAYSIKAYNHRLGESHMTCFAAKSLAGKCRKHFPGSLNNTPMLLPTNNSTIRPSIDQWLMSEDISPRVIGEFDDSALLKAFGQSGAGVFFMPSIIENEVCRHYGVFPVGSTDKISEQFYALSLERQLTQGIPLAFKLYNSAKENVFSDNAP